MFILITKEDYDIRAIVFFCLHKKSKIPYLFTTKTPNLWLTPFLLSERKR